VRRRAAHEPGATLLRVKWMCESCGFIYDPAEGDLDGGIPAGTAFEDIPETWFCPVCGARKQDFTRFEE
jgi:rubredoxin